MSKLRIGLLGTGIIIRDFHLPVVQAHPRAAAVALGNLHPESLASLAQKHSITKTYTNFDDMARDEQIDAVINGLPNYLHAPVTIQMLRAGKHVLCEKPMALNVAEAQAMIDAAAEADRKLMIGHMWRFDREVQWLRDVVRSGVLGTIYKIKAQSVWLRDGPTIGSWFVTPEFAGGGAFADMGVHPLDMIAFLFDDRIRVQKIFATQGAFHQPIALEDTATVLLEYDNGLTAVIEAGWYHRFADGPEGALQVFGTQGYARIFPTELHTELHGAWGVVRPTMPTRKQQTDLPMYAAQFEHFVDCILSDKLPIPDGQQGLCTQIVLDAVYQSARSGQAVHF